MKKWNYRFTVPENKKVRMIVHTDCKNEADDQFALAHHLMTDKFVVEGILGGHFHLKAASFKDGDTVGASIDEIHKVLDLMGLVGQYPVVAGSNLPLEDEQTPRHAPAVDFIIKEAMREDDDRPLFISMLGAITDLASAILIEPRICERLTTIWIGGGTYPLGGPEANLKNDVVAVNVVMNSKMPLWQVPENVYLQMTVSLAELQYRVAPHGELGRYLFEQMVLLNDQKASTAHWPHGETWCLGDNPTVSVFLEDQGKKHDIYDIVAAPTVRYEDFTYDYTKANREIRVYHTINTRLTMEDFYAKLALNYGEIR